MADKLAEHTEACVSTSGSPLSKFASETWPKCFVEFFYGDAVPNMTERGSKGNGTVHVSLEDIFEFLQDRLGLSLSYSSRSKVYATCDLKAMPRYPGVALPFPPLH